MAVTTYEYNEAGRLVRSVTRHEPEWLEDDRDWALAELQEQRSKCPGGCGMPMDETVGPKAVGKYEAPPPAHCHACEALAARRKEWVGFDSSDKLFRVHRKDG